MSEKSFYQKAAHYWACVPPTVNGVLGGFGHISETDIEGSQAFLKEILSLVEPPDTKLALDCGAGIGRISKNLLINQFEKVDLVEQDEKFINTAKQSIGETNERLGTLYKNSLQSFKPSKKYDVIWCQWVLGHLCDFDLINFLERCGRSLTETGVIVVKENITTNEEREFDYEDSSMTRPLKQMLQIFEEASLKIVKTGIQTGFPEDIYPVHMFALIPLQKKICNVMANCGQKS